MRRVAGAALAATMSATLAVGVSACGNSESKSITKQAQAGDGKGYIGGDGTVEELSPSQRNKPVSLSGRTLDGKSWNVTEARGKVVVLNVWGAWCGPCQEELPQLEKAWKSFSTAGKPVVFMGVDQRDSQAVASSTLKARGVTYPSLADDGGQNLVGLQRKVVATPTTLVLDQKGRIAGRVSGATDATTVTEMVKKLLSEKA